jgi:alginate O-acetyltransferase complex protein AlgI
MAGALRCAGLRVGRICPSPWLSDTLAEFWGRRWNMAFHHPMREKVYLPLARRWGGTAAAIAVFAVSGLLHELVISLPAGGGWGLPTLYFAIHGGLMLLERRGWLPKSRLATAAFVLLPAPILFHPPFIENVVLPLVMP